MFFELMPVAVAVTETLAVAVAGSLGAEIIMHVGKHAITPQKLPVPPRKANSRGQAPPRQMRGRNSRHKRNSKNR